MGMTIAKKFKMALNQIEQNRDLKAMVQLFSDDCELHSLALPHALTGREGCERFWKIYRHNFETIESRFIREREENGLVLLEWISTGKFLNSAKEFSYQGVSILELDDSQSKIQSFRTYYDSQAMVPVRIAA
jgi:limonene-1,2-epoxide hydrolase